MTGSHLAGKARFLAELNQCGRIEHHVCVDHDTGPIMVEVPLRIEKIPYRLRGRRFVNGTDRKRFLLGGQTIELPLCNTMSKPVNSICSELFSQSP